MKSKNDFKGQKTIFEYDVYGRLEYKKYYNTGSETTGIDLITYEYDAYGKMIGGNPTIANPANSDMLYSSEQFDNSLKCSILELGHISGGDPVGANYCSRKLLCISSGLLNYAKKHQGNLPDDIASPILIKDYIKTQDECFFDENTLEDDYWKTFKKLPFNKENILTCPYSIKTANIPFISTKHRYFYVGKGKKLNSGKLRTIILFDNPQNHRGFMRIIVSARNDLYSISMSREEWRKFCKERNFDYRKIMKDELKHLNL